MFPRNYFPGRFFAPVYWPDGIPVAPPADDTSRYGTGEKRHSPFIANRTSPANIIPAGVSYRDLVARRNKESREREAEWDRKQNPSRELAREAAKREAAEREKFRRELAVEMRELRERELRALRRQDEEWLLLGGPEGDVSFEMLAGSSR